MKKVLVLGGTGAMGSYLVPKLAEDGCMVDVLVRSSRISDNPNVRYLKGNGKDKAFVNEVLKNGYDGIVDFIIYHDRPFEDCAPALLENTGHYIYLSSYRAFDDKEHPIVESSPKLLHSSDDAELTSSNDYCIHKARGEDYLRASSYRNYTIIRPAITYSSKKSQLITLERQHWLPYLRSGRPVPLCDKALTVQGTMSWAGDVAEMIRRLLFNDRALLEDYNVTTSEHHEWRDVAEYYTDIFGLTWEPTDEDTYLRARDNGRILQPSVWQLHYDRLFDRVMDNTKVLEATGLTQADLMPLYDGLLRERETVLDGSDLDI